MILGAVDVEPFTVGAGVSTLGVFLILVRVLLANVSSQGSSWETLSHAQQADAASARAETASVRDEMRRHYAGELAGKDAVITAMGVEISDLKQQLRDRGPLP